MTHFPHEVWEGVLAATCHSPLWDPDLTLPRMALQAAQCQALWAVAVLPSLCQESGAPTLASYLLTQLKSHSFPEAPNPPWMLAAPSLMLCDRPDVRPPAPVLQPCHPGCLPHRG